MRNNIKMPNRYRKIPIIVEAIQWNGNNFNEIYDFSSDSSSSVYYDNSDDLCIVTLEGTMKASIDDWIIKGVNNELYPCKPSVFEKTYHSI